jgi:methylmalonyl-CoA/ethylmalonyl-CoA epimerase
MSVTIHHVGLAVHDVEEAAAYYTAYYGMQVAHEYVAEADGVRELMLPAGGSYLQLLEPTRADSPVARCLERRGPGMHHLALGVGDAAASLARLQADGVRVVDHRPRLGSRRHQIAFVQPAGALGTLTELVQRRFGETER